MMNVYTSFSFPSFKIKLNLSAKTKKQHEEAHLYTGSRGAVLPSNQLGAVNCYALAKMKIDFISYIYT